MAQRDFRIPIDMHGLELRNAVAHLLAAAPGSPTEGQFFWNTVSHVIEFYNGTTWFNLGTLDQISAPVADVSLNTHKIVNLLDPTAAQDAATKNYVDATAQGLKPKAPVIAATTTALAANTYANGASGVGATLTANANGAIGNIDGVAVAVGDRVLVKDEVATANNGIYTVTQLGTGGTPYILTRAVDNDVATEFVGAYAWTESGGTTNKKQAFFVTTTGVITVGTTGITWAQFSGTADIIAGAGLLATGNTIDVGAGTGISVLTDTIAVDHSVVPEIFAQDIGDGATTSIVVTHNLGTRNVCVSVWDNTTPFSEQYPEVRHTSTNSVTLVFAVAPTTNQFHVVIHG